MLKDFFNQMPFLKAFTSSKPIYETQGSAPKKQTLADLNNDIIGHCLSFLSPYEIAQIKRVSWGYYKGANQALNHYRLIDKNCEGKLGLNF